MLLLSVHSRENCVPCTASTFKPRIDSHHGGTWDSPVAKHEDFPLLFIKTLGVVKICQVFLATEYVVQICCSFQRLGVISLETPQRNGAHLAWRGGPRVVSSRGMHERFPPELQQQCGASLRVDQRICGFRSRLSHEAFPQGCPTCHRGVSWSTA